MSEYIIHNDKLHERRSESISKFYFHCPGCGCTHSYDCWAAGRTERPNWTFNGNYEKPSFTPSLLYPSRICHLYLTDGKIKYLGDCSHPLAGQTVDMVSLETQ